MDERMAPGTLIFTRDLVCDGCGWDWKSYFHVYQMERQPNCNGCLHIHGHVDGLGLIQWVRKLNKRFELKKGASVYMLRRHKKVYGIHYTCLKL